MPKLSESQALKLKCGLGSNGDQLGPIGKGGLDLNVVDHLRDAFHALIAGDDVGSGLHHIRNRTSIACPFNNGVSNKGDSFGIIQLHTTGESLACHFGGHSHQQFVFFAWG